MLLVSGSGQNTGKTTLVCRMIELFSPQLSIAGIKITHHFHPLTYEMPMIADNEYFKIFEEIRKDQPKDSSRMLNAGAARVFFVISEKEKLGETINELLKYLQEGVALVCESGGLTEYILPGLHLHVTNEKIVSRESDPDGNYHDFSFKPEIDKITFEKNSWKLNH
jgi:hypothetical protein